MTDIVIPISPTHRLGRHAQGSPVLDAEGRHHASQKAAAKALGVVPSTISYHLNRYGSLENIHKRAPGPPNAAKPITIGDHTWPSKRDAAAALGIADSALYSWTRKDATKRSKALLAIAIKRYDSKLKASQARKTMR